MTWKKGRERKKLDLWRTYRFIEELLSNISMENISNTSNCLEELLQNCISALDKLAPREKKQY